MRVIRHLAVNIEGLLRNVGNQSMAGYFNNEDGTICTHEQAKEYLAECIALDWKLLPMGECDDFDHFGKGCPGHKVKHSKACKSK